MDAVDALGDFTATRRLLLITPLAIVIGLVGALLAKALLALIALATNLFFFGRFSTMAVSPADAHLGAFVIVVPVLGGLIIGLMARYGSDRIRGHGIPEAIEAILMNGSRIQPRVALLKPLSSAISIGSGGPFGAEGPIIMTGGAFGSVIAQFFHLTSTERKTLLVAGAAAGMSATFASPVAAVLLAVELLLFEMKPRSLIPVITACVVSAAWRPFIIGHGPLFPFSGHLDLPWWGVFLYVAVGIVGGLQSGLLTLLLYKAEDLFERLPVHWMWWPAIGGLLVGLGALIEPRALGVGYDIIAGLLNDKIVTSHVITILVVKSVIWIIALASGTSGGVLAPLLIFGGCLAWLEGLFLPGDAGAWALLGMAAMMGGTMRSPLTGILFAVELTGHYGLIEPLLVCTGSAYALTVLLLKRSILTEKIARRGQHVVREYSIDPFELLRVSDVMVKEVDTLPAAMRVDEAVAFFCGDTPPLHKSYPLVDETGVVVGVVGRRDILRWRAENPETDETLFDCISDSSVVVGYPDEQVAALADRMVATEAGRVPIVDRTTGRIVGLMTRKDLMRTRGDARSAESDRLSYFLRKRKVSATTA